MKKIVVKDCENCPYLARNYKYNVDLCDIEDREIEDIKKIPEWCPLEELG